jgi:uncharacterized membrane protein
VNKNFAIATLAGTVAFFILGYVLYGLLLMGFFQSNAGSAMGVSKETPDFLWLILGNLVTAAFLGVLLGWKGANDVASGAKAGALVGFLLSLGYGLTMFATSNISNLTATLVDPFVSAILFGVTGAVMGMMLGKGAGGAMS